MLQRSLMLGLILVVVIGMLIARPAAADQGGRLFLPTDYVVQEPFLHFWSQGDVLIFGYPISPLIEEIQPENGQPYQVQYFERVRLERHPDAPQQVRIGRLGAELNPNWSHGTPLEAPAGCTAFAATGHMLCGSFAAFWQEHGGLEIFGYPITPRTTQSRPDGRLIDVQYTERARFEQIHGSDQVMLGLLGRERYQATPPSEPARAWPSEVREIIALVNQERVNAGLAPLDVALELMIAAQNHSASMAASGLISHAGIDGSGPPERMRAAGYNWARCGENIAVGQTSAAEAMHFWMHSPPHRANILDPNFREIGVGFVRQAEGYGYYWTINLGVR
ncbi:MAG: CAP domain-containing protein [Oscillochloris sp.]|nr:CAP domain-containing protein [Oscillochloris sp.]